MDILERKRWNNRFLTMLIIFNSDHQNGNAKTNIVLYQDMELNEEKQRNKIRTNEGKLHSIETINLNQLSIPTILAYLA